MLLKFNSIVYFHIKVIMALQINYILLDEADRLEQIHNFRLFHKSLRDQSNPFEITDCTFKQLFRLSKQTVIYLIDVLSPHINDGERDTYIPKHLQIFAALHFFGSGSYQMTVGRNYLLGLSQPAISRSISLVVDLIIEHLVNLWIRFPYSIDARNRIKQRFLEKFNFPGVIGAIDCTHVAIIAPPVEDPMFPARIYFNRKGYTSINTQVICDADLNILSINARYPGSTHDAAIWATSNVKAYLETNFLNGDEESYLLGDSGYPLQPWLLTPIDNALEGTPEEVYTRRHISTRNCIERFNGVFKSRFRCLLRHRVLNYKPVKAAKIIYSCAALHNIAAHFNDNFLILEDEIFENVFDLQNENNNWLNEGQRIRNRVVNTFFT